MCAPCQKVKVEGYEKIGIMIRGNSKVKNKEICLYEIS